MLVPGYLEGRIKTTEGHFMKMDFESIQIKKNFVAEP